MFVGSLAACGGSGSEAKSGADKDLVTVRVGTQPYYDYQFFKVASALGIDREFGLDLVDVPMPGQNAYAQLASGDIDITASCQSCALPAIENLPALRNFLITEQFKGFVLIGRSEDDDPEYPTYDDLLKQAGGDEEQARKDLVRSLEGKTFAINPAADGALLGSMLDIGGLTPDDVKVTPFPDEVQAAIAFIRGEGDYYFGSLPQELRMLTSDDLKDRFVEAGPPELFPLNYANFAAMSDWLEKNEETALRLIAIWFRVTRYLYERPDQLLDLMAEALKSQTGGLLTNEQTELALTEFNYFATFEDAGTAYFDEDSPTWEGLALESLYTEAVAQEQIPEGTDYSTYEVSERYYDLLADRPDLVALINKPL